MTYESSFDSNNLELSKRKPFDFLRLVKIEVYSTAPLLGWDVHKLHLDDLDNPSAFYICEPLTTNFTAMGVVDRKTISKLYKNGTKKYGTSSQIAANTGVLTSSLIDGTIETTQENIELLITAHIINFCSTKTAQQTLDKGDSFKHFGCIVYFNPEKDSFFMRPLAAADDKFVLAPEDVALLVCNYIMSDFDNHPEYFDGRELFDVLSYFIEKYPDLRSKIGI